MGRGLKMKNEMQFFIRKRVDTEKLEAYGFQKNNGVYCYQTKLLDGQFLMEVSIKDGEVQTKLTDAESDCEYTLHVIADAQGEFVTAVRTAYENVLFDIREKCFVDDVFKSDSAKAVMEYIANKYDTPLEFLWKKFPDNAVYRRKDNQKWYAAILTVDRNKIGLDGSGKIEIIDLKIDPTQLEEIIDHKRYFPGYHMNKKYWYTICLDGSVGKEELLKRIDISYELAKKK